MQALRVVFTRRNWNPGSWLIRWAIPNSRFALALASHCMLVDGEYVIEASMLHGVRRERAEVALKGHSVVKVVDYILPDPGAGIVWARSQIGKRYDWRGALGLALSPDRDWQSEEDWFCFELVAAAMQRAGRVIFNATGHITGTTLLLIKP